MGHSRVKYPQVTRKTIGSMAHPKIFILIVLLVVVGVTLARPGHLGGFYGGYGHGLGYYGYRYPFYGYGHGYGHGYGYGYGYPYFGHGYGHYGYYL